MTPCPECGSNRAYPARDFDEQVDIIVCPECGEVSYPVPELADLKRDVEKIEERMNDIENMPFVED